MQPEDWVELQEGPIAADRVVSFVSAPAAGGIAVFLGTTRDETHPAGRRLLALDYEAYPEMARRSSPTSPPGAARWPIVRLALLHRVGRVAVAEPSVVIAVATPHRAEAFDACRWLIDTLKAEVAVWKKEVWDDGTGTWVGETTSG